MRRELRPALLVSAHVPPQGSDAELLPAGEGELVGIISDTATTSSDGLTSVIKAAGMDSPIGPGLVPTKSLHPAVLARAKQAFAKDDDLEVSLSIGQRVWILQVLRDEPEWCEVMTFIGARGLVPHGYLDACEEPLPSSKIVSEVDSLQPTSSGSSKGGPSSTSSTLKRSDSRRDLDSQLLRNVLAAKEGAVSAAQQAEQQLQEKA